MNGFAQCHFVEDEVFGVGEFLVDFLKAHTE